MNEWGIPDWQNAAAYEIDQPWSDNRWRWEFYRRRDDLRADFDAALNAIYPAPENPNRPGFTVEIEDQFKYGYLRLPNPRIGDQPECVLHPYTDSAGVKYKVGVGEPASSYGHPDSRNLMTIWGGELAVKFDLSKPLAPQLKIAREVLKKEQKAQFGSNSQRRKHYGKWRDYLRTLDAHAAGAKWIEIADALRLSPTEPGNAVKAASDTYEAANELRFNFPN